MRYDDDVSQTHIGIDESTAGFIDIQFGLIAILILALSVTTTGLIYGSEQLERSQSGSGVFIQMFLSNDNVPRAELSCPAGEGLGQEFADAIQFGNNLALCAEWSDGVAVLGPLERSTDRDATLFVSGDSVLPTNPGSVAVIDRIQRQTFAVFPCLAPLDRRMQFGNDDLGTFLDVIQDCNRIHFPVAASALEAEWSSEVSLANLRLPGLDLFIIEGHADGERPGGDTQAAVAGARAERILFTLLRPRIGSDSETLFNEVNGLSPSQLSGQIDRLSTQLPGLGARSYQSGLLDLVPLSRRVSQECYLEVHSLARSPQGQAVLEGEEASDQVSLPIWCAELVGINYEALEASGGNVRIRRDALSPFLATDDVQPEGLRIPRLFALSDYGRFSLRHGGLGPADNRNRRVEFRFLTAAIPAEIHQLVRETRDTNYYLLYTAAATMVLHQCDIERAQSVRPEQTCVEHLNRLVRNEAIVRPAN